jgi:hypothetical protein
MFRQKVRRDAEFVKNEARVVVSIDGDFNVSVKRNDQGKLSVIGIIGSGISHNGYYLQESLLDEIGISCSRPFHKGKVPESFQAPGEPKSISSRYRGFSLSQKQYFAVAPAVFKIIQQLVDERVAKWRSGTPADPYFTKGARQGYSRSKERMTSYSTRKGFVAVESGARFSVELNSLFAPDIFWAGYEPVRKFARLINMRLEHRLERKRRSRRKSTSRLSRRKKPVILRRKRKNIDELRRFEEVRTLINKNVLPEWLLPAVVLCLPEGRGNKVATLLERVLPSWQSKTTLAWEISSKSFSGRKIRLGDIKLWLKSFETEKNYAVFEVLPSEHWWKYVVDHSGDSLNSQLVLPDELTPEELSDLPF